MVKQQIGFQVDRALPGGVWSKSETSSYLEEEMDLWIDVQGWIQMQVEHTKLSYLSTLSLFSLWLTVEVMDRTDRTSLGPKDETWKIEFSAKMCSIPNTPTSASEPFPMHYV